MDHDETKTVEDTSQLETFQLEAPKETSKLATPKVKNPKRVV